MEQQQTITARTEYASLSLPYAGDISPTESWNLLRQSQSAQLIDVRTPPEWMFSGLPDLTSVQKDPVTLSWRLYPDMGMNPAFAEQLDAMLNNYSLDKKTPLLFLCKTGGRSAEAACAMTRLGWEVCYNVAGGFEGEPNAAGQRGSVNGWKAAQLPWRQA